MTKSTNPFDDDDGDDSYDEEEMARALEAMDIDTDFDCWTSFRASMSIKKAGSSAGSRGGNVLPPGVRSIPEDDGPGGGGAAPPPPPPTTTTNRRPAAPRPDSELTQSERTDADKWSRRVHREEVYSKYYRPVPREGREVKDLASFLGVSKNKTSSQISRLLFPSEDEPKSILLKRGPVLLRRGGAGAGAVGERELILLTRGFIVATPVDQQSAAAPPAPAADGGGGFASPSVPKFLKTIPSGLNKKFIRRHFETAEDLTSVVAVEDVDLLQQNSEEEENSFAVVTEDGDGNKSRYVFTCAKPRQKEMWLDALAVSVVQVMMHTKGGSDHQIGWQHDMLRTSIYSAAVRGDDAMLRRLLSKEGCSGRKSVGIDALDSYCGYTALHYATIRNRPSSMEALLGAGASAVAMDKDMREPIYYAEKYKHSKAVRLLESYGATRPPPVSDETLFGFAPLSEEVPFGAAATKTSSAEKAAKAKTEKAQGAAGAMNDNMAAMRERGERLNRLENKTAQLETNATAYRDTARQLKEKAKKQNIFGL